MGLSLMKHTIQVNRALNSLAKNFMVGSMMGDAILLTRDEDNNLMMNRTLRRTCEKQARELRELSSRLVKLEKFRQRAVAKILVAYVYDYTAWLVARALVFLIRV